MAEIQTIVELIVVGNELLNGTTLDTNSHWISKRIVDSGGIVTRKTTISDSLSEISGAFRDTISRNPGWIISLGGLGPTFDDMTLEGLGLAIHRRIKRNKVAVEMIRLSRERRIMLGAKLSKRISKATLKMADIPVGSVPLRNSVGTAPGVMTLAGKTKIVSLPGVPKEMKAIFAEEVKPMMKKDFLSFKRKERWITARGISESVIAPNIEKLMKRYSPLIYIKSHPIGFRNRLSILKFQISVSARADDERKIDALLSDATRALASMARKLGASVET
jgi:nicotinamide-nucleotide amidase